MHDPEFTATDQGAHATYLMSGEPEAALPTALDSVITRGNIIMTRIRRGGYVFKSWIGDHRPRHIHVYSDTGWVLKWDLENNRVMEGEAPKRVIKIIRRLQWEGRI